MGSIADAKWDGTLVGKKLPELVALEKLIPQLETLGEVKIEAEVPWKDHKLPIYSVTLGTQDKSAPCLGLVGGVHGLERIGSKVVISWLHTLCQNLTWDKTLSERLKHSRLVFMPIINPVGMLQNWRSNGRGVDLMRNAPLDADEKPTFLVGGHQYGPKLPWYRGNVSDFADMEIESKALLQFIEREVFSSKHALTIDVHSGFGVSDRLWLPYARTKKPPADLAEFYGLKTLFDRNYPNHFYVIEPQSLQYTTHGDLWDWLYDKKLSDDRLANNIYLPWTLELGSWSWLRKNPRQIFSRLGAFNPGPYHRRQRVLRRHFTLLDFLHRALLSHDAWAPQDQATKDKLVSEARALWYKK